MKIDIVISANHINKENLKGKITIVIDMLRATSVITTALGNGANRVIPITGVEEAFDTKDRLESMGIEALIGGERKAMKVDGFDMTNSPLEYIKEKVEKRDIILSTTNGTRAINLCLSADRIYIGSFLNGGILAEYLSGMNKDIVIVNSGTNGELSLDDFICSGYIIEEILKHEEFELTDIAKLAKMTYENNEDVYKYISNARHYNVLKNLNLEKDMEYCCKKNIFETIPYYDKQDKSIKTIKIF